MSKENMNNTGVNCVNSNNGVTCSLEKTNSKQNDVEFAAEFNPNLQDRTSLTGREFKPNKQQMPSERTAWN